MARDRPQCQVSDGGATWIASSALPDGQPPDVLAIDPQNQRVIYAHGRRELFKSTDGGESWADTGFSTDVRTLAIDPQDVNTLAIDPQNSEVLYAGTFVCEGICDGRVFKSTDGGHTWITPSFAFTEPACSWAISALAIDPQNQSNVYATTSDCNDQGGFLFKSTDGGTTWKRTSLNTFGYANFIAVDLRKPSTIFAPYQGSGVARSTDGGETWSVVNSGLPSRFVVNSLAIDGKNPSTLYAEGFLPSSQSQYGIFKSIDRGANWVPLNDGLSVEYIRSFALAFSSSGPNILYAATASGLFKFIDDTPLVSMDSAQYCLGGTWNLKVGNSVPNTAIHLSGLSNGQAWEIPEWGKTDATGSLNAAGKFAGGTEGSHTLTVEIAGAFSNAISFAVWNCKP